MERVRLLTIGGWGAVCWETNKYGSVGQSLLATGGAELALVNAACTSQVCSKCGCLGRRSGDTFHCIKGCGAVMQADIRMQRLMF